MKNLIRKFSMMQRGQDPLSEAPFGPLRQKVLSPCPQRRGSVLIMVVTLLVLLAIMGTAYLVTVRTDRVSSIQSTHSTQVDLVVQSVAAMVEEEIRSGVFDGGLYRPWQALSPDTGVEEPAFFESPAHWQHTFLADREPTFYAEIIGWPAPFPPVTIPDEWEDYNGTPPKYYVNARHPGYEWRWLSWPKTVTAKFSDPRFGDDENFEYANREHAVPGWVHMEPNDEERYRRYPGLHFTQGPAQDFAPALDHNDFPVFMLAADTDGDGIADAPLMRISPVQQGGITWYVGMRIIDNAGAVNLNTAWSSEALPGEANQDRRHREFPSNIGLFDPIDQHPETAMASLDDLDDLDDLEEMSEYDQWAIYDVEYFPPFEFATAYEAYWTLVGRRLNFPGFGPNGIRYRRLPVSDSLKLAHGFVVRNPAHGEATVEALFPNTFASAAAPIEPYRFREAGPLTLAPIWDWGNENFSPDPLALGDGTGDFRFNRRPLLTTTNPVSDAAPDAFSAGNLPKYGPRPDWAAGTYSLWDLVRAFDPDPKYEKYRTYMALRPTSDNPVTSDHWEALSWSARPAAASLNTATFPELWRAFAHVMDDGNGNLPDGTADRMFQVEAMRHDKIPGWTAEHQRLVRAAVAAVNTIDLRDSNDDITSRTIAVEIQVGIDTREYEITVFGTERQPYITAVMIDYLVKEEEEVGENGEVIITRTLEDLAYVAVELHNPHDKDIDLNNWHLAAFHHADGSIESLVELDSQKTVPAGGYLVLHDGTVPDDVNVDNEEDGEGLLNVMLEKNGFPIELDGPHGRELVLLRPRQLGDLETDLHNLVPVDQVDLYLEPSPDESRWIYTRPSEAPWQFVYPGPYNTSNTPRTQGLKPSMAAGTLGSGSNSPSYDGPILAIQLAADGWAGPNKLEDGSDENKHPYGGFARIGDVLQVPFIGGYRVTPAGDPATVLVMNSVTMDSVFAEKETELKGNEEEEGKRTQLGRFVPRLEGGGNNDTGYDWTRKIFAFFTVFAPHDDYLPNVNPDEYEAAVGDDLRPQEVFTADPASRSQEEDGLLGIEGRININTAPWRVLATVPWVSSAPPGAGPNTREELNASVAKSIVYHRNTNGPFTSLFDLNDVWIYDYSDSGWYSVTQPPAFLTTFKDLWAYERGLDAEIHTPNPDPENPDDEAGDFSPDKVAGDFEKQYLSIVRVSNLITTRSDSFTAYVSVQGWRDAGDPEKAELEVERRFIMLVDRSGVTIQNGDPRTIKVEMD
jgi:hypothetical protein